MVTISNGIKTFRVTAGSIKPYVDMGFHVVLDEESSRNHVDDSGFEKKSNKDIGNSKNKGKDEEDVITEEVNFIEELLEKPLSQWNSEEVKEFVRIKGLDTSGAQKVSQVRAIIKSYLEEQNKNN